jgi:hypothetical protein
LGLKHCLASFEGQPAWPALNGFDGVVDDDPHKPGGKRPLSIKLFDPSSNPQECVLHDFLGNALIVRDQEGSPDGFNLILSNQEF